MPIPLYQKGNRVWITTRVMPGSSKDEIKRGQDGILQLRVRAAPTKGRANEAARNLLANALGVPPTSVKLEQGAAARRKKWAIEGLSLVEVKESLKLDSWSMTGKGQKTKEC